MSDRLSQPFDPSENREGGSLDGMVGRASGTEAVEEKRRWLVDYRHHTKAPHWWRLSEVDKRQAADDLVKYWTWRGCDVRVTAVVEVVKRTVTVEEPEISSPNQVLAPKNAHNTTEGNAAPEA